MNSLLCLSRQSFMILNTREHRIIFIFNRGTCHRHPSLLFVHVYQSEENPDGIQQTISAISHLENISETYLEAYHRQRGYADLRCQPPFFSRSFAKHHIWHSICLDRMWRWSTTTELSWKIIMSVQRFDWCVSTIITLCRNLHQMSTSNGSVCCPRTFDQHDLLV